MSQDSLENIATFGAWVVVAGVALEGVDWYSKYKKRNRCKSSEEKDSCWTLAIEFFSIALVVLGLSVEIIATYKASLKAHDKINQLTTDLTSASNNAASATREARDSKVLVAQISITNAQLVATNLELQKEVVELQMKLLKQVRHITPEENNDFIKYLKSRPHKKPIKIFTLKGTMNFDFETRNYAFQLWKMLKEAGYEDEECKITEWDYPLTYMAGYTNRDNPFFIVIYGQQGNVQWSGIRISVDENGQSVVLTPTPDDTSCLGEIDSAFKQIGVVPDITIRSDWDFVKTNGDWAIFIPPKF